MTEESGVEREPEPASSPAPLRVAAAVVAIEGGLMVALSVVELLALDRSRVAMGLTTGVFFAAYGLGLVLCARALLRRQSWARSPVVLAQLIQLGTAWSFVGGETTGLAAGLAVVSLLVLAGLFHPASTDALAEES